MSLVDPASNKDGFATSGLVVRIRVRRAMLALSLGGSMFFFFFLSLFLHAARGLVSGFFWFERA